MVLLIIISQQAHSMVLNSLISYECISVLYECLTPFRVTAVWSAVTPSPWSRVWCGTTLGARWGSRWPVITAPNGWLSSTSAACFYTPESTRRRAWSCSAHTWSWNLFLWSRWLSRRNLQQLVGETCFYCWILAFFKCYSCLWLYVPNWFLDLFCCPLQDHPI